MSYGYYMKAGTKKPAAKSFAKTAAKRATKFLDSNPIRNGILHSFSQLQCLIYLGPSMVCLFEFLSSAQNGHR